jgi:colanic acid/amylovoran biosynthesis glycosyltransferase
MPRLCIIRGHRPLISETFLDAHVEFLEGEKTVLYNYYPEYTHEGRALRYFYSEHPTRRKLQRLLPAFLYDRFVTRHEGTAARTRDFLNGFFRRHQTEVILAEYGFNGADITPHARELGIPLIVHFHGHDAHRGPEVDAYRERYEAMFDYAFRLVSVSRHMTARLIALGAPAEKIVYNPYGARDYFFEVQPSYEETLVALGRFADIKAPYLTLMAFRTVLETLPEAKLVMIGDGPLREACLCLAKTWGIEDRVTFPGALTHEESFPFLAQACAFVQHSVTTSEGDAEGLPNSILEAGASALPVIATRHTGIPDAVIDGKTGFLVEERDLAGMAAAMERVLSDSELARAMGAEARCHMAEHFRLEQHIARLQGLIALSLEA